MTIVKNAPVDDEGPTGYESDDAAASSLLKSWGAKDEPAETEGDEPEVEVEDDPEVETEEEPEADPEDEPEEDPAEEEEAPASKTKTAGDDDVTEVRVGDKVHKVAVKDLKRLFGQEQALTQKSQEVAELRSAADRQFQRSALSLQKQVEKAKARASQFDKINLTVLARDSRVSDEEIRAVMADQAAAKADVDFFEGELDELVKEYGEEQGKANTVTFKGQAEAARNILTDPASPLFIPKFLEGSYQSVLEYGVRQGIPAREMANEVNPLAISTLWKAMKYDAGQAALKAKGNKVVPKVTASKKVAKPGAADTRGKPSTNKALERLRSTGSDDDAAAYYLARMGSEVD